MTVAIFKGEKSIKDLLSRLFNMPRAGSNAATKNAADDLAAALLKANPQLSDLSKVPVGSIIAIPPTAPPLKPGEQVASPAAPATVGPLNLSPIAAQAQQILDQISQRLSEIETRVVDAGNALLTILNSDPFSPQPPKLSGFNTEDKQASIAALKSATASIKGSQDARKQAAAAIVTRLQSLGSK